MSSRKILSVIVPSYNVEKFLTKTLDSMCCISNITDLEILVVNDGSKDSTIELANKYKSSYPESIIVIDKENGGHGSTINAGIKAATGKYFKVIDGDDWVDSEQFEIFVEKLKQAEADLILSPFRKVYEDVGEREEIRPSIVIDDGVHQFNKLIDNLKDFYCMHAITFKTSIYKKVPFQITEHCFYVDMEFILYPVDYITSVQYLDQCVYQYRLGRPGQSVSMESKIKNKDMHKKVIIEIVKHCLECRDKTHNVDISNYLYYKVVTLINIQYSIYLSMTPSREVYRELKDFKKTIGSSIPQGYWQGISRIISIIPASYWIIGYRYRKVYVDN